jgi:hypothetical protein
MLPIVIYRGPSNLDGSPIVAIATLGSSNEKTGKMVQTWILRADVHPSEASSTSSDASVCGECPRRHSLGGDCYVLLPFGPGATFKHWTSNDRPDTNWQDFVPRLRKEAQAHGLRMGSYGDPAAVPWHVWSELIEAIEPTLHTGYTHQWRNLVEIDARAWYSENLMASCDSGEEATLAQMAGWRTFTAIRPSDEKPDNSVQCLADREKNPKQCKDCGICNGAQGRSERTSVYLVEHGARSVAKHKHLSVVR